MNKEFQWNQLSKQDYLYFLTARVSALCSMLGKNETIYFCIKDNGDVNGIFIRAKVKRGINTLVTYYNISEIIDRLKWLLSQDIVIGNIGKIYYIIHEDEHMYYLSRFVLGKSKIDKRIMKSLTNYRQEKIKSEANEEFNKKLSMISKIDPEVIVDPRTGKRKKFFMSDIYSLNEELERR